MKRLSHFICIRLRTDLYFVIVALVRSYFPFLEQVISRKRTFYGSGSWSGRRPTDVTKFDYA